MEKARIIDEPAVVQRTMTTSGPVPQAIPGCGKISDEKLKELNIPVQCFPGSLLVPDRPIGYAVLTEEKKEKLLKGCTGVPIQEPQKEAPIGFADKPVEQAETSLFASWAGGNDKKNSSKPAEPEKERKKNTLAKSEVNNILRGRYRQREDGKWHLVDGADPIVDTKGKAIKTMRWDHTHNEIEAYTDKDCVSGSHAGALDPATMKIYKPGDKDRDDKS